MQIFGLFLQVGILWFLITLFSGATNSDHTLRLTWIVVIGMMLTGILTRLLLGGILGPFLVIVDAAVLYLLVDKVCSLSRRATRRICGWYLGLSFLVSLFFSFLGSA